MGTRSVGQADRLGNRLMRRAIEDGDLETGANERAVVYLERALKTLGFNPGVKDRRFTAQTAKALAEFQTAWGLEPTGKLDAKTVMKLDHTLGRVRRHGSGCPDCQKPGLQGGVGVGQKNQDVRVAERRLKALGYDVGKVDGTFDRQTAAAVLAFKRDQRGELKSRNGFLDRRAWNVLGRERSDLNHVPFRVRVLQHHRARKAADLQTSRAVLRHNGFAEGDEAKALINVQKHLKHAGFDPQRYDGRFDERTAGAVRAFQRQSRLPETGRLDARTWRHLQKTFVYAQGGTTPAQRPGERSAAVLRSERILKKLGYRNVKVDGLFDAATQRASRAFERKHGYGDDGAIGGAQLEKMQKVLREKLQRAEARRVDAYVYGSRRRITVSPIGGGHYLRTDAARDYKKLIAAAKRAGVPLYTNSGFRSMAEQRRLYAMYLNGTGNPAARPGYSNHQGGVAVDIGGVGPFGSRAYNWLARNAGRFGFNNVEGRGVNEPWHWVYSR